MKNVLRNQRKTRRCVVWWLFVTGTPEHLNRTFFLMESGGENGAARRVFPRNASEFLVLRHKLENFINEPHSSTCAPLTHLRGDRHGGHGGRRERELRPGGRAAVPERLRRSREEGRQKSTRGPAEPPGPGHSPDPTEAARARR